MLTPELLISPIFSSDSLSLVGDDKTMRYYFHSNDGPVYVGSGSNVPQYIQALKPPDSITAHSKKQFQKIIIKSICFLNKFLIQT